MKLPLPDTTPSATQLALLAIAQFLLFEATVESLMAVAEAVSRLRCHTPGEAIDTAKMTGPFRVRYALFRRMLDQDRLH